MKKQMIALSLSCTLITANAASIPFLPKTISKPAKTHVQGTKSNIEEYADFSGEWVGTCESTPDEELALSITQSPDASSILFDNRALELETLLTNFASKNFEFEGTMMHFRWNETGQQLLGTVIEYYKKGHMSMGNQMINVSKVKVFLENEQLINLVESTRFEDGNIIGNLTDRCVYKRQPS
ncbi:hypothetical protein DIZ81_11380 [Legionella taurinensis]|uniref:DUF1579 domain-containing protein n=1 Tax=Legionella taurinensis TaxID=70611 RepID=A0A3A5LBE6_9GAMM|nr:hypothetical protein [Legionella taurinensis]MDX1838560.1 hypothetical protein [Legionella taurinensis]PUT39006.1 hypothetical protein DB744_11390 [Legionella taurinensis]PUT41093.1 hypothetical protein DB746_09780 [Legionella taurinensis]PUT43468.1 hypothetical protein DB743_10785 [Legionella taurinensis]PUT46485.1 hypothetical protein DB745_10270 [Legionella taurinensis]